MNTYYPLLIGFIASLILMFLAIKIFPKLNLLDFPERYGLKRKRLPYPGGLVFIILILIFLVWSNNFWWLIGPVALLGFVSFIDDKYRVATIIRLILHVSLAVFVFYQGIQISFIGNPLEPGTSFDLTVVPYLSLFLSVAWIVVIQNAMNWFDGIKGLSVGISGVGFLALGIFGLVRNEVAWEPSLADSISTTFYLAGICAGAFLFFLRGRIILGDTGSQVLGFLLAVFSIFAGTKIATTLLILGLPILDSVLVVFRRIFQEKKSPFKGDLKHLHHNLAYKIGETKTSLLLISISALLGIIAIFLTGIAKLACLGIVVIAIIILNKILNKKKFDFPQSMIK